MNVVLIPEEVWMNSQLSIARHYGRITLNGNTYVICNKNGVTIFELSDPDSKYYVGDNKAIEPGELYWKAGCQFTRKQVGINLSNLPVKEYHSKKQKNWLV